MKLIPLLSFILEVHYGFCKSSVWQWKCMTNQTLPGYGFAPSVCEKAKRNHPDDDFMTMEECNMVCHSSGIIWPKPTGRVTLSKDFITLNPRVIDVSFADGPVESWLSENVQKLLRTSVAVFRVANLFPMHPDYMFNGRDPFEALPETNKWSIEFRIFTNVTKASTDIDESYHILVRSGAVYITAENYFGARHALETMSQLLTYNDETRELKMYRHADITDKPIYQHRGLLIDTARNYLSINQIHRILVGMSYNKMNVLHWHITDSQSFPLKLDAIPQMSDYGAYSDRQVYKMSDIDAVRGFAEERGIRVLIEIDTPAHMGAGWQWGKEKDLGDLVMCFEREPWQNFCVEPPCGQINPLNDNSLDILEQIYRELWNVLEPDMFHMGGDEVNINCWNSTAEFDSFFSRISGADRTKKEPFYHIWALFQQANLQRLTKVGSEEKISVVYWTSEMTKNATILKTYFKPKDYIFQDWGASKKSEMYDLAKQGYRVIASHYDAWYLDCGFASWVAEGNNWCSPYKGWQQVYDHNPRQIMQQRALKDGKTTKEIDALQQLIIGGEVALWGEQADDGNVDTKIWPRSAAFAERMWSDPATTWENAEFRMMQHRYRMKRRLHSVESLQPAWCLQNQGHCYTRSHRAIQMGSARGGG